VIEHQQESILISGLLNPPLRAWQSTPHFDGVGIFDPAANGFVLRVKPAGGRLAGWNLVIRKQDFPRRAFKMASKPCLLAP
jgi:hypothetical protein